MSAAMRLIWRERARAIVVGCGFVGLLTGAVMGSGVFKASPAGEGVSSGYSAVIVDGRVQILDDGARCPLVGDIASVVTTTVSPSATSLDVTTTVEVKAKDVSPPAPPPLTGAPAEAALNKAGAGFLASCVAPFGYTVKSLDWRNGELSAVFDIPPTRARVTQSIDRSPVIVGGDLRRGADVAIQLCTPAQTPAGIDPTTGKSHPTVYDEGERRLQDYQGPSRFVPYVCRARAKTAVNVTVDGFGVQSPTITTGHGLKDAPTLPSVKSSTPFEDCLCTGLDATPMPDHVDVKDGTRRLSWHFSGYAPPVRVGIDAPFRLRAGIWFSSTAYPLGNAGVVSVSYFSYASAALVAVLAVALVIAIVLTTWRERLAVMARALAVMVGTLLIGGIGLSGHVFPAAPYTLSATVGLAMILLALMKSQRRSLTWALLGVVVVAVAAVATNVGLADFASKHPELSIDALPPVLNAVLLAVSMAAVLLDVSLLVMALTAAFVMIRRIVTLIRDTGAGGEASVAVLSGAAAFGLLAALGYSMAALVGPTMFYSRLTAVYTHPTWWITLSQLVSTAANALPSNIGIAVVQMLPLIAIALLTAVWRSRFSDSLHWISWIPWPRRVAVQALRLKKTSTAVFPSIVVVALLLSLAAPWSDTGAVAFIVMVPMWLVQFVVLLVLLKLAAADHLSVVDKTARCLPAVAKPGERVELVARLRSEPQPRGGDPEASRLLELGPADTAIANATYAARISLWLSVVPIVYIAWTTIDASRGNPWSWGFFFTAVSILQEVTRWVLTGYIYGFLHPRLPGNSGPVKALCLTGVWAVSAWAAVAIARIAGAEVIAPAIYRTAEFAVFVVVLSLLFDIASVRSGGGTWHDLRQVYARHNYVQIVVVVAPILLSVFALIDQVAAGAGLDAARTVVSGVRDVVTAHTP